jgi:hypothetical protein
MRMIKLLGFQGLSMSDLLPYLEGKRQGKVVGITFDDGYQNNLQNALPVLKRYGFTATCYGVSSMLGGTNAWDLGKVAEKPLMTLNDWHIWKEAGMDVGSHTCTHAKLTELPLGAARQEIVLSRKDLEHSVGSEVRHFCYPYGAYHEQHVQMAQDAGYATATTTHRGRVHTGDNPFVLSRIMVARATNPIQFFLKIATAYEDRRA